MSKPPPPAGQEFRDTEPASTLPMAFPGDEDAYADTAPMPLASVRPAPIALALAPLELTLYEVLAQVRKGNRICPQPTRWLEFYRLLETMAGGAPLPSAPLVGSAWTATTALAKSMCFREQLEWADAHGGLEAAHRFLHGLSEAEWQTGG